MIETKSLTILVAILVCQSLGSLSCLAFEKYDSGAHSRQAHASSFRNSAILGISSGKKNQKGTDMADSIIAQASSDGASKPKAAPGEGLNLVDLSHVSGRAKAKPSSDVKPPAEAKSLSTSGESSAKTPIGEAWLEKDGTLTMHLMRDGEGHYLDAQFSYKKTDKDYGETIKHIGGIKPGEHKLVPPFDETSNKNKK
ncbi:MAG TPA: hypothetical protein V6C97_15680 [Oculatellaceae cyanobacterium]